jgi:uncharacterized protein
MHAIYFHGFGSGPKTAKGIALGKRLSARLTSYQIPALEGGDFYSLTMERILDNAAASVASLPDDDQPVLIIGSSLGGYTAALLAAQNRIPRASALLLIAPAFGFSQRWAEKLGPAAVTEWERTGKRNFYHFASESEQPLGVNFLRSVQQLPGYPIAPEIPVVIVHGRRDETVDWRESRRYADQDANIELHLVDGDHRLTEPRHEALIGWCAEDLLARMG